MLRVRRQSDLGGRSIKWQVQFGWLSRGIGRKLSLTFIINNSGVVQLVAHGPLEPRILVRVQAPEPLSRGARRLSGEESALGG